jgi:hypothetical protein
MGKYVFAGTGISKADDPASAGKEAVEMAIANMKKQGGKVPDFGVVYCSAAKYAKKKSTLDKLVKAADAAFKRYNKKIKWVGATTRAEFSNYGFSENSVVAMALESDYVHFGVGVGKNPEKDPTKAGEEAAKMAVEDVKIDRFLDPYMQFTAIKHKNVQDILKMKPYFLMTIFPGPTMTYLPQDNAILKGVQKVTGVQPTFGGDAAEDWSLTQTYTIANGEAFPSACITVVIISDLQMGHGVAHGYKRASDVMIATKAKGNIVYEINHQPAAEVYSKFTGVSIDELKKFFLPTMAKHPFGILDIEGNYWINCPYGVAEKNGVIFFEPVKEGTSLTFMSTNLDDTLKSAEHAVKTATKDLKDLAVLFVFSCSTRILCVGDKIVKEAELMKKISHGKPFIGFSCYAEHAMIPTGTVQKHGFTFVCGAITDKLITS